MKFMFRKSMVSGIWQNYAKNVLKQFLMITGTKMAKRKELKKQKNEENNILNGNINNDIFLPDDSAK